MPSHTVLTADLCRAARALIDMPQAYLAEVSGVSERTIRNFESGRSIPIRNNIEALQNALEKCSVQFVRIGGGQLGVVKRYGRRPGGVAAQYARR